MSGSDTLGSHRLNSDGEENFSALGLGWDPLARDFEGERRRYPTSILVSSDSPRKCHHEGINMEPESKRRKIGMHFLILLWISFEPK